MYMRQFTDAQRLFYKEQHKHQTYDYVIGKQTTSYNKTLSVSNALRMLDSFVDPSDPDVSVANSIHAYQTAERIRKAFPYNTELQVCGLIHDLGKILFYFGEPNWSVVGDTYVVGCQFPETIVFHESFDQNPDTTHEIYSTPHGVYEPGCGIENLHLSYGHDEYLYQVLYKNRELHRISQRAANVIRFHSFYPWHTEGSYSHFERDSDAQIKEDVLEFNKYDLYSKLDTDFVLTDEIQAYYDRLLTFYFPEPLLF